MRAIEAVSAQSDAAPHCVRLSDDPQLELLVTSIGAPGPDEAVIGASVAVHIQAAPSTTPEPAAALEELFDLSPSTARFAWALAQTGGIAESAEQLGLTIETARFYSKTLYAKLGVKGQAELTRRVLTSAAALA